MAAPGTGRSRSSPSRPPMLPTGWRSAPTRSTNSKPLHQVAIVHMGLALGEIFDLDALSAACAADGRYEFMLAATPLKITGAAGLTGGGGGHPVTAAPTPAPHLL